MRSQVTLDDGGEEAGGDLRGGVALLKERLNLLRFRELYGVVGSRGFLGMMRRSCRQSSSRKRRIRAGDGHSHW